MRLKKSLRLTNNKTIDHPSRQSNSKKSGDLEVPNHTAQKTDQFLIAENWLFGESLFGTVETNPERPNENP